MLIGELIRQSGLPRDTIRHYEQMGLLRPRNRPQSTNSYKDYPADTVVRLVMIRQAKQLGFSLAEISEGLELMTDTGISDTDASARIAEKLAVIEKKMYALEAMRAGLLFFQRQIQSGHCSLQVPLADRPEQPPNLAELFSRPFAPFQTAKQPDDLLALDRLDSRAAAVT